MILCLGQEFKMACSDHSFVSPISQNPWKITCRITIENDIIEETRTQRPGGRSHQQANLFRNFVESKADRTDKQLKIPKFLPRICSVSTAEVAWWSLMNSWTGPQGQSWAEGLGREERPEDEGIHWKSGLEAFLSWLPPPTHVPCHLPSCGHVAHAYSKVRNRSGHWRHRTNCLRN